MDKNFYIAGLRYSLILAIFCNGSQCSCKLSYFLAIWSKFYVIIYLAMAKIMPIFIALSAGVITFPSEFREIFCDEE